MPRGACFSATPPVGLLDVFHHLGLSQDEIGDLPFHRLVRLRWGESGTGDPVARHPAVETEEREHYESRFLRTTSEGVKSCFLKALLQKE